MSMRIRVPIPAIRGRFGRSLLTFQTQIAPRDLIGCLGHDPRSDKWRLLSTPLREMYETIQRKTNKSRREGVEGYLEDRVEDRFAPGAFPAICIGMTRPPDFTEGEGENTDVGILRLDISAENTRILLDGLGRATGSLEFVEGKPGRENLFTLPTTIFAPTPEQGELTLDELGQLFFDFNFRAVPLSPTHAMELDQSDPYLRLTNKLGASEVIQRHGGMETRRQSLGSKSTAVVVQAVLLRFVRGACEGPKAQKSNKAVVAHPNLTRDSFPGIRNALDGFLRTFEGFMGEQRFGDRQSLHLTSVGWQALGLVANDLIIQLPNLSDAERDRIVKEVAGIDWSRSNKDMIRIGVLSEVDGSIGLSGRGVAAVEALHDYVVSHTSLKRLLAAEGPTRVGETAAAGV